jgi:hypothetical protein
VGDRRFEEIFEARKASIAESHRQHSFRGVKLDPKPGGQNQRIYGATRGPLIIESSPDLKSWSKFMKVENPPNPAEFSLPFGMNGFFRAREGNEFSFP